MAFPSILALFIVSHLVLLLLLHSAGEQNAYQHCPRSFICGHLGHISFPFSNTTYPQCELCTVDCSQSVPKLNFGMDDQIWYDFHGKFLDLDQGGVLNVTDTKLQSLIRSNSCDVFSSYFNLTLPSGPSISFTVSPNLTLFKCPTGRGTHDYFRGNHSYSFKGCSGYTVYYKYPPQVLPTNASFPKDCSVFQLPVVVPSIQNRSAGNLFSVLASEFSLGFHVSNECIKCRLDGGQCPRDKCSNFQCIKKVDAKGSEFALILGTAAAGIGILVILLLCIMWKLAQNDQFIFFWDNKTKNYRNVEAFLDNQGSLSSKRYTYSDIKKMTNSFRVKLGQGGNGCVFKGTLENGCLVAVKVLNGLKGSGEEFINEVATISRTSHVNIVTLMGFCFEGYYRALVYEFMPNGSLEKFIHDGNSLTYRQLGWEALYEIAVGIARGLEYLHRGCNMLILHFDIKPHNILLDEDFCPKISDFGLAKLCPRKESIISLLGARGTAGYIAPEVFCRNFGRVSHKSDVYSYGMMVLEMVGGRKNIDVKVDHASEIYFPHWIYKRLEQDEELGVHGIMTDEANERANERARKMIIVGLWCIQTDPSHRPSMSRVMEMLEGSLESLQIPPKPYLSSPSRSPTNSSTTLQTTFCDSQ